MYDTCSHFTALDYIHADAATLPVHLIEHSYAEHLGEPVKMPPRPKVAVSKNSTMLSAAGNIKDVCETLHHPLAVTDKKERLQPPTRKTKVPTKKRLSGSIVTVIHEGRPVAKAVVMDGTLLHGEQIPSEYVKVSIKELLSCDLEIPLQFKGPFDDDDDILTSGLVTAWKLDSLS